eukprot:scaffold21618_cov63-Attheya_sp.AAC.13
MSPQTLPLVEYNIKFKKHLRAASLLIIGPMLTLLALFDTEQNDVNSVIGTFYASFTVGYTLVFLAEILVTTILRLGVFAIWEQTIFDLTPKIPVPVLSWVLRENKYHPKRITIFVADFATSCIACPIIEEYIKLKIVQLTVRLPRNFKLVKKRVWCRGKKKWVREKMVHGPGGNPISPSLGLNLCDSIQRVLMYTKRGDMDRGFYAIYRDVFPIHEVCGTMTALSLTKHDVLGVTMPTWKMLAPAVFIHGMANFRGMKPIFKWNSSTPWSEMQLSPWNTADDSTFPQILSESVTKLMWLTILGRALGYCVKNYYLIGRQAIKRTTTYASKHVAFKAGLAADEILKTTKDTYLIEKYTMYTLGWKTPVTSDLYRKIIYRLFLGDRYN